MAQATLEKKGNMDITISLPDDITSMPVSQQGSVIGHVVGEVIEELLDVEAYDKAKKENQKNPSESLSLDEFVQQNNL